MRQKRLLSYRSRQGSNKRNLEAEKFLEVANNSSQRLSVLHAGFLAACVYVLVIVFGTTDLDLLIGKGVKLPFVNVEVPIVGFYVFAPYILVLVHFNLLLQLGLLSRKLHAFDSAASREEKVGGIRDQLHIFPFTYYIAGKPEPRMRPFIALLVSTTVIILPLFTLLSLQMVFLAYQDELSTWIQRIAIWGDIFSITYFWPLIINPYGASSEYWQDLYRAYLPSRINWLLFVFFALGILLFLFGATSEFEETINMPYAKYFLGLLLIPLPFIIKRSLNRLSIQSYNLYIATLMILALLFFISPVQGNVVFFFAFVVMAIGANFIESDAPRGSITLLLSFFLILPLSFAMMVDGGALEHIIKTIQCSQARQTIFCEVYLENKRTLELSEKVLLAKQPDPETIARIRSGDWKKSFHKVEPIDLKNRNLRHADISDCILVRADLRNADLKGANLIDAQLQWAILSGAQLQGADLTIAQLQGARLSGAQLQGANLWFARLQGARLSGARLQGAILSGARLQGAILSGAQLQGADLTKAQLQGADLTIAQLQGADLRFANIYSTSFSMADTALLDARDVSLSPIPDSVYVEILKEFQSIDMNKKWQNAMLNKLKSRIHPNLPLPTLDSCIVSTGTPLNCSNPLQEPGYTELLHTYLVELACTSPYIAHGLIIQSDRSYTDFIINGKASRFGLASKLLERLDSENCRGLSELSDIEKENLRQLVRRSGLP